MQSCDTLKVLTIYTLLYSHNLFLFFFLNFALFSPSLLSKLPKVLAEFKGAKTERRRVVAECVRRARETTGRQKEASCHSLPNPSGQLVAFTLISRARVNQDKVGAGPTGAGGKYAAVKFPCGGRQLVFAARLGKDLCSVVAVGSESAPAAEKLCEPDFKRVERWQNDEGG